MRKRGEVEVEGVGVGREVEPRGRRNLNLQPPPPPEPESNKKETPEPAAATPPEAAAPPHAKVPEGEALETMAKEAENKVLADMENARKAKVYTQDGGSEDAGGDERQKKPAGRPAACKATPKRKSKKAATPKRKRAANTPKKGKDDVGEGGEAEDSGPLTPRTKKRKTMQKFQDRPLRNKKHTA